MLRKIKDYLTLKRRKVSPSFNYADALVRLSSACQKCKVYTVVLPGVYYDAHRGLYCVHFECATKEYTNGETRAKYFLSIRRNEKMWGDSLEKLLDYAITYAEYDDAFIRMPKDNLPEGIKMSVKNIHRTPGRSHIPTLPKWRYQ